VPQVKPESPKEKDFCGGYIFHNGAESVKIEPKSRSVFRLRSKLEKAGKLTFIGKNVRLTRR
jgi:hypothetical protein